TAASHIESCRQRIDGDRRAAGHGRGASRGGIGSLHRIGRSSSLVSETDGGAGACNGITIINSIRQQPIIDSALRTAQSHGYTRAAGAIGPTASDTESGGQGVDGDRSAAAAGAEIRRATVASGNRMVARTQAGS